MNDNNEFSLANDIQFSNACSDFTDGIKKPTTNPLQTIGDRARLIRDLRDNGFSIVPTPETRAKELKFTVAQNAICEVVAFDESKSWLRWHLPDFSDNGNIDLPDGEKYKIQTRIGNTLTLRKTN